MTGFNQVVIKLQLILTITICDYDEDYNDQDKCSVGSNERDSLTQNVFCNHRKQQAKIEEKNNVFQFIFL